MADNARSMGIQIKEISNGWIVIFDSDEANGMYYKTEEEVKVATNEAIKLFCERD